jgi:hypothetical protein
MIDNSRNLGIISQYPCRQRNRAGWNLDFQTAAENEHGAEKLEIDGKPTQEVVKSGIVKGYSIDLVVDAIRDNPHS